MSNSKHIIDNTRVQLADVLRSTAQSYKHLSIATGYWDLPGTKEILDQIDNYESIRLLIGQEPLSPRNAKLLKLDATDPQFPDSDFAFDLVGIQDEELRLTITRIKELISQHKLEVRVYRRSFLHAKCYIFGNYESGEAVGIIGSSNFTKAGLTTNTELNALEDDHRIVKFKPHTDTDEHGHLSWFDSLWNDEKTENWNGKFTEILSDSPLGDLAFGPYDMYIKTLMEVYPDELVPPEQLDKDSQDVLYTFQYRNAQILINKLERMGLAMLSDSVGLGKTITSGAVINHYRKKGATRIYIIAPASLKRQWRKDLAEHFKLIQGFEIISLQDAAAIERARELDQYKSVDLFVIDEAHNLRNASGRRHQQILDWFIDNPDSKVLMLTATPINNSLVDFINQIQLGSKGALESINVDYRDENGRLQKTDFFHALTLIQTRIKRAENRKEQFDWDSIAPVVASGLRHYLVRTTRQGIKQMGGIVLADGTRKEFPASKVEQIGYQFSDQAKQATDAAITNDLGPFEGHDPRKLDLDRLLDQTQRTEHPLDTLNETDFPQTDQYMNNVFANIFQIVLLLGFTPYRPDVYQHRIHRKTIEKIRDLGLRGTESGRIQSQLSIHNMLRVTWLKRLESSQMALRQSVQNYLGKIESFERFLNQGKILSFQEIDAILSEFGEDIDEGVLNLDVFEDADTSKFDVAALKKDLLRDKELAKRLLEILDAIHPYDDKIKVFAKYLQQHAETQDPARKKFVIFSYFSDTVRYLEKELANHVDLKDFSTRSAFVTGGQSGIDEITGRFAPKAKKYTVKDGEIELDFLFATDVLSEGQNLQDAGSLINYDLHWNPVRMIQRNGRINRLGSDFDTVYVANMKPEDNLEAYLLLLNRLNRKIDTIRNTIGLDQDVLNQGEVLAKEFIEHFNMEDSSAIEVELQELYGDDAGKVLERLEEAENRFFVDDDFVYDLRDFLARNMVTPEVIQRVQSIPIGKWGHLPANRNFETPYHVMGLAKTRGQLSISNEEVLDSYFVIVDTSDSAHRTESIEDSEALRILKASETENHRQRDTFKFDRLLVNKRVVAAAKAQASRGSQNYSPKPSEQEALREFESLLPGRGLLRLVTTKITNKKELRELQKLLRSARSQIQEHGQILAATIREMDAFSMKLNDKVVESTQIDEVSGVLFYAK